MSKLWQMYIMGLIYDGKTGGAEPTKVYNNS